MAHAGLEGSFPVTEPYWLQSQTNSECFLFWKSEGQSWDCELNVANGIYYIFKSITPYVSHWAAFVCLSYGPGLSLWESWECLSSLSFKESGCCTSRVTPAHSLSTKVSHVPNRQRRWSPGPTHPHYWGAVTQEGHRRVILFWEYGCR